MKLQILDTKAQKVGDIELPKQFDEKVRDDLIERLVFSEQARNRDRYGADPVAGNKASSEISRRRRDYRGSYGKGISRVTRKIMTRNGSQINWVGATSPNTRGGRRAHPPKSTKIWEQKINTNEARKALRSALAATLQPKIVASRNHNVPKAYPFVLDGKAESSVIKTKDAKAALTTLGFTEELARTEDVKTRAGRGKTRGRRRIVRKGLLVVVSKDCAFKKAIANIPGFEAVDVKELTAQMLAPGAQPGRLTVFTTEAIERIKKEALFANKIKPKRFIREKKKE